MPSRFTGSATLSLLHLGSATGAGNRDTWLEAEVLSLFDQFREPLLRYLSGFGLALEDGEDVIQEVFLALFRHLRQGKSRQHLRGWLFRVAHNIGLKQRLRSQRATEVDGTEELAIEPGPGPEEQLVNGQTQQQLLSVVAALAEQDRRCLFLRAEGLRYREISEVLDMSLGAVSLSLSRSLGKMTRVVER
jgi:RNA polymerase sigma-70 factor (ECF subfamily)